ncbi:MAG: hypothetical protein H6623_05395 [Bdellovibrionaceae bacterium]|nr:hypothetical protein [Pseudobdellovibrionaceae bacterium]
MDKRDQSIETCYACETQSTSREHFPPKSFFPEKGKGLQLKTVPSCDLHNGKKSLDDQYVLTHICLNTSRNGSNLPAKRFLESVLPALNRSPKFRKMLAIGAKELDAGAKAFRVDIKRFDSFFDQLVRAIYFDRFDCRLDGTRFKIHHHYPSFEGNKSSESISETMEGFTKEHSQSVTTVDSDKVDEDVYRYQLIAFGGSQGSITLMHTFYGVFKVVSLLTFQVSIK